MADTQDNKAAPSAQKSDESAAKITAPVKAPASAVLKTVAKPVASIAPAKPVAPQAPAPAAKKAAKPAPKAAKAPSKAAKPAKPAAAPKASAKKPAPAAKKSEPSSKSSAAKTMFSAMPSFAAPSFKFENPSQTMESLMSNTKNQFEKFSQEATSFNKSFVECCMKSGNISAKRGEEISKACMALAQDCSEKYAAAFKALMGCKTINELTEAQNRFAQEYFDDMMSGATKIAELSVKAATETFEPLNDQITKAVKKASETMAA